MLRTKRNEDDTDAHRSDCHAAQDRSERTERVRGGAHAFDVTLLRLRTHERRRVPEAIGLDRVDELVSHEQRNARSNRERRTRRDEHDADVLPRMRRRRWWWRRRLDDFFRDE